MREIRPSGLEGGVARKRHPYPYQTHFQKRSEVLAKKRDAGERVPTAGSAG